MGPGRLNLLKKFEHCLQHLQKPQLRSDHPVFLKEDRRTAFRPPGAKESHDKQHLDATPIQ